MRLRPARAADLDAVAEIERGSFADPWSRASFASLVGEPRVVFAVATDDGDAVLGYVVAWFAADEAEIANVAVAAAARGQGVGAALLDAALDAARVRRTAHVFLEVRASNVVAQALYASRGFAAVGRRTGYYRRPPEDAIVMRREMER